MAAKITSKLSNFLNNLRTKKSSTSKYTITPNLVFIGREIKRLWSQNPRWSQKKKNINNKAIAMMRRKSPRSENIYLIENHCQSNISK